MNSLTDLQIRQLFEWVIVREASKLDGEADEFLMSFGNAVRLAGEKEFQLIRELAVTVIAKYQLDFRKLSDHAVIRGNIDSRNGLPMIEDVD